MDHTEGQQSKSTNDAGATDGSSYLGLVGGDVTGVTALVQPWLLLSVQLTPLIGESGFRALVARALRLSDVRAEPLIAGDGAHSMADVFTSLARILNEIGPEHAANANSGMLDTFTRLLANLIGEALTKQLLHVALAGGDGQRHAQEQK